MGEIEVQFARTQMESGAHLVCVAIVQVRERKRWIEAARRLWLMWLPGAIALPMLRLSTSRRSFWADG